MSSAETKKAIVGRAERRPSFAVVPEHAIKLFDRVISETDAEALQKHPNDKWARIQFWKEEILSRVIPSIRGLLTVYYHEYIAALLRNDGENGMEIDTDGPGGRPYNPHAEAIAQRDAYLACTAGLT
jgi:hypothetical protein